MRYAALIAGLSVVMIALGSPRAGAQERFVRIPVAKLQLDEGTLPTAEEMTAGRYRTFDLAAASQPYAALDGGGEVYIVPDPSGGRIGMFGGWYVEESIAFLRVPAGAPISGRLFWPNPGWPSMRILRFSAPAADAESTTATRHDFFRAKSDYYRSLANLGIAGAAWFRHQAAVASDESGDTSGSAARLGANASLWTAPPQFAEDDDALYGIFGGGRAVSENLQLGRTLMVTRDEELSVAVDSLPGITVRAMDWSKLTAGLAPETDPLAECIPADQHAVFFPSFQAMIDLMDEAALDGTPVARLLEPRSEDAHTRERYERQLCLVSDALSRLIGPTVIRSVAFSGSDPYLRTGSDVAVLFEAVDAAALQALLAARQAAGAADSRAAKPVQGEVAGVAYQGVVSPDRAVCSYLAVVARTVIVSNSLPQLTRIVETAQGKTLPLARTDDYKFFRDRYKLGEEQETALLVLSDAAIRRWCSARWRIGAARRLRAAAVLTELQARNLDKLVKGTQPGVESVAGAGQIGWTREGPQSSIYGTLSFMTPIAEIAIEKVSSAEAAAYRRFADGYQRNWTRYFDPIAVRVSAKRSRLATDLTVMPLIAESRLREFVAVTQGAAIKAGAGDPHADALLHLLIAINRQSEPVRSLGNSMSLMSGRGGGQGTAALTDPLGWLGSSIAVYVDKDPVWDEAAGTDLESFIERNYGRLPLAIHAEVADGLKLAVFLTTLRTIVEQSAPGLTRWSTEQYKERPYAKITVNEPVMGGDDQDSSPAQGLALHYISTPRTLIVTLSEALIKRVIDRTAPGAVSGGARPTPEPAWLGDHLALRAHKGALDLLERLFGRPFQSTLQARAWSNIPILNEWHRVYPDQSPVAFHQRYWQTRLSDSGGGQYVWNDEWQTMESTSFGHPGAPKGTASVWPTLLTRAERLDMGVTFENDGLRARMAIDRVQTTEDQ